MSAGTRSGSPQIPQDIAESERKSERARKDACATLRLFRSHHLFPVESLRQRPALPSRVAKRNVKLQSASHLYQHTYIGAMLPRVAWLGRLVPRIRLQHAAVTYRRDLSTLSPVRLTPADYMDLSGRVCIHGASFWKPGKHYLHFPDQTHGFFYYVPGPAHAPVAGEVRFRITPSAKRTGFKRGHDLLLPSSPMPWRVPLVSIIQSKRNHLHMYERLCEDGVINNDLVAAVREHESSSTRRKRTTPILHSLSQPFYHEISKVCIHLCVAQGYQLSKLVRMELPLEYPRTYAGGTSSLQCLRGRG
jgi:hypothetical protein